MTVQEIQTMEEITQDIFDKYIPEFWKRTETNLNIINSFSGEFNSSSISLNQLYLELSINNATGDKLDSYGVLFSITRNTDETDEHYRTKLLQYFQIYLKGGTDLGIQESIALHLELEKEDIVITPIEKIIDNNVIANMEAGETWTGPGVAFDATISYTGLRSIKLTSTGAINVIATETKALDLEESIFDLSFEVFSVWYNFNDASKVDNIKLTFTDGIVIAENTLAVDSGLTQGFIYFHREDFTNVGTIDWSAITSMALEMQPNALTSMNFDFLTYGLLVDSMIFDIDVSVSATFDLSLLNKIPDILIKTKPLGVYCRNITYTIV